MVSTESQGVLQLNRDLRDAWLADPTYGFDDMRRIFEAWLAQIEIPAGTTFADADCGGVPCIWADAPGVANDAVVIHFHSGGYLLGSANGYRSFGGYLSAATFARVLLVDYRLAPEAPFPAAIDDALSVYRWVLAQGTSPARIIICGDSAGGGLALIALQAIRDEGLPLPTGGIAISPMADFTHSGESREINQPHDPLVTIDLIRSLGATYCGDVDPADPRISPLFGDWTGLPPLRIYSGEIEMLRDDGKLCVQAAQRDGVDARYIEGEGMAHIWTLFADRLPEARSTLQEIGAFARERFGATGG